MILAKKLWRSVAKCKKCGNISLLFLAYSNVPRAVVQSLERDKKGTTTIVVRKRKALAKKSIIFARKH
ncbi:MAG TPA: hypothetical protein VJC01_02845 [Candidatus Paceibacterota bacterium]